MTIVDARGDLETLLSVAKAHYDDGQFSKALDCYQELDRLTPENAQVFERLALCYMRLQRWSEARGRWIETIERHGVFVGRVTELARCYVELGDYEGAWSLVVRVREKLKPTPFFLAFAAAAALGSGEIEKALDVVRELESLPANEDKSGFHALSDLLGRLMKRGCADRVFDLIERSLPIAAKSKEMIYAGMRAASLLGKWDSEISFARQLKAAQPDLDEGYFRELDALIDNFRFEEFDRALIPVKSRFPKSGRSPGIESRFSAMEDRKSSWSAWKNALRTADSSNDFQSLSLRAGAYMTLRRYDDAIAIASKGVRVHRNHPWFMCLLGISFEALGDFKAALFWFSTAVEIAPEDRNYLFHLCKIQIQMGLKDEAATSAQILVKALPRVRLAQDLLKQIAREAPELRGREASPLPVAPSRTAWLHAGDAGDIVYSLAAMRAGGGGHLYLTALGGTREPMVSSKIEFLAPLLTAQPYIDGISAWQGEEIGKNFLSMRHVLVPDEDLATTQWHSVMGDQAPDVQSGWLTAPLREKHGRPVFARSFRYRNRNWDIFWEELKASSPDALFVGTEAEFKDFGHGEHYFAKDALDLAQIIGGASVFVGNQSLPYSIAEGLKVGRMLEVSPFTPNCIFPGALAPRLDRLAAAV